MSWGESAVLYKGHGDFCRAVRDEVCERHERGEEPDTEEREGEGACAGRVWRGHEASARLAMQKREKRAWRRVRKETMATGSQTTLAMMPQSRTSAILMRMETTVETACLRARICESDLAKALISVERYMKTHPQESARAVRRAWTVVADIVCGLVRRVICL